MGQYYYIVNRDRGEYVSPQDLGAGAKLAEICASDLPRILPYLLRQSTNRSGGDPRAQSSIEHLGRWAGDRILVIGDYDDSGLYREVEAAYENISVEIQSEVNEFLLPHQQLGEPFCDHYRRHDGA